MTDLLTTKRTFLIVLFLGLLAMTTRNVTDPDIWWHLKTGQYVVEHRSVPHADPFSFTRAGQPWIAHEWLTEVFFFGVFRVSGWAGLILSASLVLCTAFFLLYLRCRNQPFISGIAALAGAWATAPLWGVRPQMLSFLLTSLWLLILERSQRNAKLLLWTLPLTVLWVNLHAGFALGLALLGLFFVGELIEAILSNALPNNFDLRLRALGLTLLVDLLLVPLNPNGMSMYTYPIATLRSGAMQNYIAEWASPNFHRAEYWPFLFLVLAQIAVFMAFRSRIRPRDLLLLLVGTFAALASIRMIPLFVLVTVPLLAVSLQGKGNHPNQPQSPRSNRFLLNTAFVVAMAVFAAVHIVRVIGLQPQAEARQFPAGAVRFLRFHGPGGHLFNHYDWGGYLIWKLNDPVFIDGRADIYGEQFLKQFADTYELKRSWHKTLDDWRIQTVIVPPDSALATGLRLAPGWRVAYEDSQAVVLSLKSD